MRKYREPDILFIKAANRARIKKQYCEKADLVIEVVSEKNRAHDITTKRLEYARAGIPEYWIVDPEEGDDHRTRPQRPATRHTACTARFVRRRQATSKTLPGFVVDVSTALSQKP